MKPESRKSVHNSNKNEGASVSNSNKNEGASCYDLTKLSEALNNASVDDTNDNIASSIDESGSLFDFTKISEALNVAENERAKILKAQKKARKKARKEKILKKVQYLFTLDLIDFESKLQKSKQRMKSSVTRTPLLYRSQRRRIKIVDC